MSTRLTLSLLALLLGSAWGAPLAAQQEIPGAMHGAEMRWTSTLYILAEKLELAPTIDDRTLAVDGIGWYGNDRSRIWLRGDADISTVESAGDAQLALLYGKLITPFFDALFGVRLDHNWGDASATRILFGAGVEGLAPYWFELKASAFISQDGDLSARLTTAYDLLFTQRLILEPRMELNASASRVPGFGIGSGLTDLELGGRLRYELHRTFAPYIGVNWHRRLGGTADFARDDGEPVSVTSLVAGVRTWH